MLGYVEVLAVALASATLDHITALREAGFSDEAIFEVVLITGYYALRCRMADGLGVDVDATARQHAALVDGLSYRAGADPA
jgi:alkylhydroperoxidase family enzyme